MKLSAKFARQEGEETRLARIARRRVSEDRAGHATCAMILGRSKNPTYRRTDTEHLEESAAREETAHRPRIVAQPEGVR